MKILIALTYYRPHISGLAIYAERLAKALSQRGHRVTVLTSRFDIHLPLREEHNGVSIVRVPVLMKVSKGVIMPLFPYFVAREILRHEAINVHMPQFEAGLLVLLGRVLGKRTIVTYHCDLVLPTGLFNRLVERSLFILNHLAAAGAHSIVVNSQDYAESSPFLQKFRRRIVAVHPPVEIAAMTPAGVRVLAERWQLDGCRVIGFAARFAEEKGVEYLLKALPSIYKEVPQVKIVFTGAYRDVIGEEAYFQRLKSLMGAWADHLVFLEVLNPADMANFFSLCDVVAVTSLNSTESFGMVQVEAMLCGTPVVASDLPGVREAVGKSGMGELVPIRDEQALAAALLKVLRNRNAYVKSHQQIEEIFGIEQTVKVYEALFQSISL